MKKIYTSLIKLVNGFKNYQLKMAKQTIDTLAELKTKLNYLKVKRCIEKKKDYDKEILRFD